MKLKKLAFRALGGLMSVALVACMLTSCSKSGSGDKLVESVPASACFVMKFNPKQVVENMGCSVDNGKIVLSEKISNAIKTQAGAPALSAVNNFLAYTEGINLDAVVLFTTSDRGRDMALATTISDAETVKKHLKEIIGNEKEKDGFTVYDIEDGGVIAINDDMLWVAEKLSVIQKYIEDAAAGNISSLAGVADVIAADNALAFVALMPNIVDGHTAKEAEEELLKEGVPAGLAADLASVVDCYVCASVKLNGNAADGEAYILDKDGKRKEFGKIVNVIDTDVLKNIPADANFVAATGNIADEEIKGLIAQKYNELKSDPYGADAALGFGFLAELDGPAAIGFDMSSLINCDLSQFFTMSENELSKMVLTNLKFALTAHYPADVVNRFSEYVCSTLQSQGEAPEAVADGFHKVAVPDLFDMYFGNKNGYFTITNYNGEGDCTALADKFAGKRAVIYSRSDVNPTLAELGWNFGSEGMIWLEDDAIKSHIELTGTDANYLQAIIEPLTDPANIEKLMSMFSSLDKRVYDSGSEYEFDYDYDSVYEDQEAIPELEY